MLTRTSSRMVTFKHPFALSAMDWTQPAGTYLVETEEELLESLSFSAYRRVASSIRLPSPGNSLTVEIVSMTPAELDAALARDAGAEPDPGEVG
jgi:hypothetical protein